MRYNHHYFGFIKGRDAEIVKRETPKLLPNPLWYEGSGLTQSSSRKAVQANFEALFSCGCLQQALNDTAAAEQSFRKALEVGAPPLGPAAVRRELDAQHNWGMTLLGLERFEEAGLVFEEVVNQDPNADESWASLGVTMAAGQVKAARQRNPCLRQVRRTALVILKLGACGAELPQFDVA